MTTIKSALSKRRLDNRGSFERAVNKLWRLCVMTKLVRFELMLDRFATAALLALGLAAAAAVASA